MPTLKVLEGKMPPIRWMPYISFIRYALEAMYVGEIVEYKKIIQLQVRRACVCAWLSGHIAANLSTPMGNNRV